MTKFNKSINKICIAYLDLLEKKSASSITIVDLCDEANVARSTFYDNFENISDVTQAITAKMEEPFVSYMENFDYINGKELNEMTNTELLEHLKNTFWPYLLQRILENKVFAKKLLKYIEMFKSEEISREFYEKIWIPYFENSNIPKNKWEKVFLYYQTAIASVLHNWVEDDCKDSVDDILEDLKYFGNITIGK